MSKTTLGVCVSDVRWLVTLLDQKERRVVIIWQRKYISQKNTYIPIDDVHCQVQSSTFSIVHFVCIVGIKR